MSDRAEALAVSKPHLLKQSVDLNALQIIEDRLRWLSVWMIHHANNVRPSRDGLKVGGHQASCASMTSIMTALYFHALGTNDRVAVKPHAGPVLHAIHYLLGSQTREAMENFRGFGGAQSYPSRTKDAIPVDFSTGSVGLGVAITAFSSLIQDYLSAHDMLDPADRGRFVALVGDAELDEGNIYEAIIEGYKHDVRNLWWVVDYNRQSLDSTTTDYMFSRFDEIFGSCGWRVETLKFGKLLERAFLEEGGDALRRWIEHTTNAEYAALTYLGGAAWRKRLSADVPETEPLLKTRTDSDLQQLMTNLGGHDLQCLIEAFDRCQDNQPTLFIAYTIKGFGLPFAGHKDNHAGLMNTGQVAALRDSLGISEGHEWDKLDGVGDNIRPAVEALLEERRAAVSRTRERSFGSVKVPPVIPPAGEEQSTQAAFGRILLEIAKQGGDFAHRILTASPDVTISTSLGGWVNQRSLFRREGRDDDVYAREKIASPQKWARTTDGQHIELGIAENNLFLLLAAAGLAGDMFGTRLIPIGTLYDPFISRGLDALNYACYQDARFILVATPSGITLGAEGGAHQSINPPLIALGQPGLRHYEPAFADELGAILEAAFALIDHPSGESTYLRLSTRPIRQMRRDNDGWREGSIKGGYWLHEPSTAAEGAIVAMGAIMPEAFAAWEELHYEMPGLGFLVVTSPALLHRGWSAAQAARWQGRAEPSHVQQLLSKLNRGAGLVTVADAAPASLSWLGGVHGHRVAPLGVDRFGQTGDLSDLYPAYRIGVEAIFDAAAEILIQSWST